MTLRTAGLLVGLSMLASGCTTIRTVSSAGYTSQGVYVGYWEGECKPILGCGIGDGKVQYCKVEDDNSLSCTEQTEISALLARKAE